MSTRSDLTTTSFAVLGLLAVRSWSSYELTRQMDRGLGRLWPRAASKLYEEPKKLVAHGLARCTPEVVGRRSRTIYTITPLGRRRLARWLSEPAHGPVLESELLLKVFFAEHGTKGDLVAVIEQMREWANAQTRNNAAIAQSYARGEAPFPERLAHTLLVGRFLADFEDMVANWAQWATDTIDGWPDKIASAEADPATLHQLASRSPQASTSDSDPPKPEQD